MALVQAVLQSDLQDIFSYMKDNETDDDYIVDELSDALKSFIESGTVTTVDAGSASGGVYAGAGSGSISADTSGFSSSLKGVISAMKTMQSGGDAYFANGFQTAFLSLITACEVKVNSVGTVTTPAGVVTPYTTSMSGTIVCAGASAMGSALSGVFSSMGSMQEGGDNYLATQLSALVYTTVIAGVITVQDSAKMITGAGMVA